MTWKITQAEFLRAIVDPSQAPPRRPAVAFAGRSNVGQSSLINSLLDGRKLARTSSTPGCTQQVVYFGINNEYYFIDLPGYGWAKAPPRERARWGGMMERFLRSVEALRLVVLLVDIRREPTAEDMQMVEWLESAGHPFIFAVTKCDKVARGERKRSLRALQAALGLPDATALVPVSARSGEGVEDLRGVIGSALKE